MIKSSATKAMGGGGSVYGSAETFEYGDLTATMEWLEKACANSNKKGWRWLGILYDYDRDYYKKVNKALSYQQSLW